MSESHIQFATSKILVFPTFPNDPTNTWLAFRILFCFSALFSKIVKILSMPIEPPVEGIGYFENIPIRLSYLPPPDMDPIPY